MDESIAAAIEARLLRRLPDCRITTAADSETGLRQRFKIRHSRIVTHLLYVDDETAAAVPREELLRLVDKAVDLLRYATTEQRLRITAAGVAPDNV